MGENEGLNHDYHREALVPSLMADLEATRAENERLRVALTALEADLNEAVSYAVDVREPWGHLRDMRNKARAALAAQGEGEQEVNRDN